jgi:prepilin-type N-terminal cleavage/methylation domain-containing protein
VKRTLAHGGFTLWELLVVLAMLGIAGLLTSQLFVASMRAIDTAPRVQEQQLKIDRMLSVLRQDVWSADQIKVDGNTVDLAAGSKQIRWTFGETNATRSSGGDGDERWPMPLRLQARQDGATLVLQNVVNAADTRRFVSQVLTAEAK